MDAYVVFVIDFKRRFYEICKLRIAKTYFHRSLRTFKKGNRKHYQTLHRIMTNIGDKRCYLIFI